MKKSSTFIYFVKNFPAQSDADFDSMNSSFEKSLTGMDNAGFTPSRRSVQTIMDFARSYDVVETKTAGQLELNYN